MKGITEMINESPLNEEYISKNVLYSELYKAIKPVFNRFDILEKYWGDNLDGFVSDFKKNSK